MVKATAHPVTRGVALEAKPASTARIQITDQDGSVSMTVYGVDAETLAADIFGQQNEAKRRTIRRGGRMFVPPEMT